VILNQPWPGFAAQRNVAVDAARHDWVIALDADERVAAPLREEIQGKRAVGPHAALLASCEPYAKLVAAQARTA